MIKKVFKRVEKNSAEQKRAAAESEVSAVPAIEDNPLYPLLEVLEQRKQIWEKIDRLTNTYEHINRLEDML